MEPRIQIAAAVVVLLTACATPKHSDEGNKRVEQISQAASLHTSITSIAPWDDIKEKLKPGFVLSSTDALAKSIPTTLVRLDRALDILRFQLALTPSITRRTSNTTASSGTGKDAVSTTESAVERASPELPTFSPPSALASSAASSLEANAPDSAADALLQYQTAANLLRDIAVLNAEIDNVSRRTGQNAFLTRIQVSVMPLQRGLGYDVYANLSLFAAKGRFDPITGERTVGAVLPTVPLVIPILSTDSLQATRRSGGSAIEREVGLALNLLKSFGAAGASLGHQQQSERSMAGSELEAVVTVGRLSDNTIRIRMGADTLPGGGYGMVPRTFNISALVFLPKSSEQLYYVSRLSLHHVLDGSELSAERTPSYEDDIATVLRGRTRTFRNLTSKELMHPLDDHAYHGDFKAFSAILDGLKSEETTPLEFQREKMYLWSQLVALNRRSRYAHSLVDVPRPPPTTWPDQGQMVVYTSDAKGLTVTLGLGNHLRPNEIDARLQLAECTQPPAKPERSKKTGKVQPETSSCTLSQPTQLQVQPSSIMAAGAGQSLVLQFPLLEPVQSQGGRVRTFLPHAVLLSLLGDSNSANVVAYPIVGQAKIKPVPDSKPAEPAPALHLESAVVVANPLRHGRLAFVVQGGGKRDLKVQVRGSVMAITDDNLKPVGRSGLHWDVVDGGRYVLSLENLSPSVPIRLELLSVPADRTKVASLDVVEARIEEPRTK